MSVKWLGTHNLQQFLERMRPYGELHAPVRGDDGGVRFAPLPPGALPDLTTLRTLLPAKKYLLHPCETILNYSSAAGYQLPEESSTPMILFGLHPCDLAGINYLDRVFLSDDPDPLYAARRSAVTLIGVSCIPDELCSCHRSPSSLTASSDLFMHMVSDGFTVTSGSARGDILLGGVRDLLSERELVPPEDNRRFFGNAGTVIPAAEPGADHPEWQELAGHCLGCGACSICCPTCACFDVLEFGALDGDSAERLRQWDNCLFKGHGQVAGGMSFRKDRAERFRYRYIHKYHGFGALKGIPACVGCGRCVAVCPSGIDLRPLAERLEGVLP